MVKKAHLITGKGGVGKSLFSAALAYNLSLQNQQILLTELNEHSFYHDYLNLDQISYKASKFELNETSFEIAQWSPEECLKEYALHLFKIESLYKLFFENPVSKSLIQIAPGLHELALLGKLTSSPRQHGPAMNYNQIVVDSFSTGHFLSLLRAPLALNESIPLGPMGEQTKSIDSYLRNSDFLQVHILCLPEELPVTEALELHTSLKNEFGINAKLYLNKTLNLENEKLDLAPADLAQEVQYLKQKENWAREQLKSLQPNLIELPLLLETEGRALVSQMSSYLKGQT